DSIAALMAAAPRSLDLDEPSANPANPFVLAPDPATEAREAVREVISALESGLSLHEIAVFHGADPAYRRLLREAFHMASIPIVGLPGGPLLDTPGGSGALGRGVPPDGD